MWHGRNRFIYFVVVVFPLESWFLSVDGGCDHVSAPVADSDDDYDDDGVDDNDSAADYFSDDGGDDADNNDDDGDDGDDDDDDDDDDVDVMMIMIMVMMRMTTTMTMIVVMSCSISTSYVLTESPSTSQNSFCYRLYFLFSYKRSAALGQFVIHRGLIISVMQVGWHALHFNFSYSIRKKSWLANKLSSGIFVWCKVPPITHEDTGKIKQYDNWNERKSECEGGSRPLTLAVF